MPKMKGNGTNGARFQHTIENETDAPLDWAQSLEQAKEDRVKIDQAKLNR